MTPQENKGVEELKKGTYAWLYPRLIIGAVLFIAFAVWIYWPR